MTNSIQITSQRKAEILIALTCTDEAGKLP